MFLVSPPGSISGGGAGGPPQLLETDFFSAVGDFFLVPFFSLDLFLVGAQAGGGLGRGGGGAPQKFWSATTL